MEHKGRSVMEAIQYLDSFYNDLGLLFRNFESLLGEQGFISIPVAGNKATFEYGVSGHIGYSKRWTLKCIQRLYLKEEETEKNVNSINKAIFCNLALYPSSAFEIPIFVCGVVRWDGTYSQNEIYNRWPTKEFSEIVKQKNKWRLRNHHGTGEKRLIYKFIHPEKIRNIEELEIILVDLVKIESSKVLQEIVDTLENLYEGNDEIVISKDLVVEKIPVKLMETWSQPFKPKDED